MTDDRKADGRLARAAPWLLLVALLFAFDPQLRPGRTVVPIDILNLVEPWKTHNRDRIPQNIFLLDAVTQHYEWVQDFHRRVRAGDLPAWQPLIAGGVPYVPNGSVAVHYPPSWLYVLLPAGLAFTVFMVVHFWIAALGMWLWLRRLGTSAAAAMFGGGAYAMSGLVHNWSFGPLNIAALALAPLVLYAVERAVTAPSARSSGVLALTTGMLLLGGNPQFAYHVAIAAAIYAAVRSATAVGWNRSLLASCASLGAGAGVGVLIGAAEILPGLAVSSDILRQVGSLDIGTTAPIEHLVRLAAPDYFADPLRSVQWRGNPELWMNSPYIGVLPAALAAVAAVRFRDRRAVALALVAVAGALFALSPPVNAVAARILPLWDRFRVSARWLSVANLGAAALGGVGADYLLRAKGLRHVRFTSIMLGVIVSLPAVHMLIERPRIPAGFLDTELRNLAVIAVVSAVGLALALRRAPVWILAGLGAELLLIFAPYFPDLPRRDLRAYASIPEMRELAKLPEGKVGRLRPQGITNIPFMTHNTLMLIDRPDAHGFTVFLPSRYVRYLSLIEDHAEFARLSNEIGSFDVPASFTTPLARMAGIRYAVSPPGTEGPPGWEMIHEGALRIFEDPAPLPDAWIARRRAAAGRPGDALKDAAFDPLQTAVVEGPASQAAAPGASSVAIVSRGADRMVLQTSSEGPGELVQTIAFHHGWRASVDGRTVRPDAANMAFLGVPLGPGSHRVEVWFDWGPVKAGRLITLVALLLVAAAMWAPKRRGSPVSGGS